MPTATATAMTVRVVVAQLLWLLLGVDVTECQYSVQRQDPFALLSATLQTYQEAACDGQALSLVCPAGTKISIQLVQYGRAAPSHQVCPPIGDYPRVFTGSEGVDCALPEALKVIEKKCHGQELCSMTAAPEVFGGGAADPCPGVRKYIEVAFKCKPTQFRSSVVCHSEELELSCPEENDQRLAIYSAAFSSAAGSHIYCPMKDEDVVSRLSRQSGRSGRSEVAKCETSHATEAVMQMCHGKKSCVIMADGESLGAPACSESPNVYLKTVFACVHKDVFKAQYSDLGVVSATSVGDSPAFLDADGAEAAIGESESRPDARGQVSPTNIGKGAPAQRSDETMQSDLSEAVIVTDHGFGFGSPLDADGAATETASTPATSTERQTEMVVGLAADLMSSYNYIRQHKEKFILFATLSVALGLTLFLTMVVWGMYRSSRLSRIKASMSRPAESTIHAYYSSPAGTPTMPPPPRGAIDIEMEVGDHEVDTAFRDPAPDPLIVAPSRTSPPPPILSYGTLGRGRVSKRNSYVDYNAFPLVHTCDLGTDVWSSQCSSVALPPPPPNGILRNSSVSRESPTAMMAMAMAASPCDNGGCRSVRYSTIGRPRVAAASPTASAAASVAGSYAASSPVPRQPHARQDSDVTDPRSLALSRIVTDADHVLYG